MGREQYCPDMALHTDFTLGVFTRSDRARFFPAIVGVFRVGELAEFFVFDFRLDCGSVTMTDAAEA